MGDQRSKLRRAIERYRELRDWVTDLRARRALRELTKDAEKQLREIERGTKQRS